ncbi:hypothetical protein IRJ41_020320, partial [Triplophysa rosa]
SRVMRVNLWPLVVLLSVLLLLGHQITEGFSFGAAVNIEPFIQDGLQKVKAYYSVLSSLPCPALEELCNEVDCTPHVTSSPLKGLVPSPGWCLRQWQKTIPQNYTSKIKLGSTEDVSLYTRADLSIRSDTNSINRPANAALLPPVRLRAGCRQVIPVNVLDLDGDAVRCRYGNTNLGAFLQLNKETCTLLYGGGAAAGQYTVEVMVEDFPSSAILRKATPFSTVSLQLSITVENEVGCPAVPEFRGVSPAGGSLVHVLPFQEIHVNITVYSGVQEVTEMSVIGPPGLFVSPLTTTMKSQTSTTLSWVRGPDPSAHLLSVCFVANTKSLQSEIRCIWLQQTQTDSLPPGTELKCNERKLQMSLLLPISFLEDLHLSGLQLNDPTCPVLYNSTHVTTTFSLTGCGTKTVHLGSELLYTNTLRSVNSNSTITRDASLVLPLACRISSQQAEGPNFQIVVPSEVETFGAVSFWLEFHIPGEGPMAADTRQARLRSSRFARTPRELHRSGQLDMLDLHVFSNCSLARAELMVGRCVESETSDFLHTRPLFSQKCVAGNGTLEVLTSTSTVRIYRLYLNSMEIKGDTMYVECEVHLCVTTKQTQRCADRCTKSSERTLVDSILTSTYRVRSGPVSIVKQATQTSTAKPTQTIKPVNLPATSQTTATLLSCNPCERVLWVTAVTLLTVLMLS